MSELSRPQFQRFLRADEFLLGTLARQENALGVLQGDGAQQLLLVVLRTHQLPPIKSAASCGAEHARPDLRKRRVAGRRRVVAERREAAVVGRAQLLDGMYWAASRTRSRISSGVSTRGSIGATTPTKTRWSGFM